MSNLFTSTALLITPLLLALSGGVWAIAEYTDVRYYLAGPAERLIALKKVDAWSQEANSVKTEMPVMLLGSSLIMSSSYLCDTKYSPEEISADRNQAEQQFLTYPYFKYFEKQLAPLGRTRVVNLANTAALISEDLLLTKESMRRKKPKLIVVGIAPRDFLDHYTSAYHRSRLAQILLARQSSYLWNFATSPQENLDRIFTKLWCFYQQRVDYKQAITQAACNQFNRSASLFDAAMHKKNAAPEQPAVAKKEQTAGRGEAQTAEKPAFLGAMYRDEIGGEPLLQRFDNDYRGRYLPLDRDRWNVEKKSLQELVDFCAREKTPLVLISMPLTKRNLDLLPPEFLSEYFDTLASLKLQAPQGILINLTTSKDYNHEDFVDTVHLRSSGGRKLADTVAAAIENAKILAQ